MANPPVTRLAHADVLLCAGTLYVVGFWQLTEYWPASPGFNDWLTTRVTAVVLGMLAFLAGQLLTLEPLRPRPDEWAAYCLRNFVRFYPPYLAALLVFGLAGMASWKSVALSAALASPLLGHPPPTIWFAGILMIYVLIAPVLLTARTQGSLILRAVAVYGLLLLTVVYLRNADQRLLVFFPAFAAGIHASREALHPNSEWMAGPLTLVLLFGAASEVVNEGTWLWMSGLAASGAALLYRWSLRSRLAARRHVAVEFVASASLAVFLLHRPLLEVARAVYFPASAIGQLVYLAAFCLPAIILISWFLQRGYDAMIGRFALPGGR